MASRKAHMRAVKTLAFVRIRKANTDHRYVCALCNALCLLQQAPVRCVALEATRVAFEVVTRCICKIHAP